MKTGQHRVNQSFSWQLGQGRLTNTNSQEWKRKEWKRSMWRDMKTWITFSRSWGERRDLISEIVHSLETVKLICFSKLRSESKMTPRFLAKDSNILKFLVIVMVKSWPLGITISCNKWPFPKCPGHDWVYPFTLFPFPFSPFFTLSPAIQALKPPIWKFRLPVAVKGMWIFGQGGPCGPLGQEIVCSHKGREYLRAEYSHSLGLQTEKHLALYQSKHPLLSPYLSLSPILLIDRREENTQAHTETHKSSLLRIWNSNRH